MTQKTSLEKGATNQQQSLQALEEEAAKRKHEFEEAKQEIGSLLNVSSVDN